MTDSLTKKLMEELLARWILDFRRELLPIPTSGGSFKERLTQLVIEYFGSKEAAKAIKNYHSMCSREDTTRIFERAKELECLLNKK